MKTILRAEPERTVVGFRGRVSFDALPTFLEEAFTVIGPAAGEGAQACRCYYFEFGEDAFDVLAGFVASPEAAADVARRVPGAVVETFPATETLAYRHVGPYEELGQSWEALDALARGSGFSELTYAFDDYVSLPTDGDTITDIAWAFRR